MSRSPGDAAVNAPRAALCLLGPTGETERCFEVPDCGVLTIGRSPENDLCIEDPIVSKAHALLFVREGRVFLEDLASTNGTFLNGVFVTEVTALHHGQLIGFGTDETEPQEASLFWFSDPAAELLAEMDLLDQDRPTKPQEVVPEENRPTLAEVEPSQPPAEEAEQPSVAEPFDPSRHVAKPELADDDAGESAAGSRSAAKRKKEKRKPALPPAAVIGLALLVVTSALLMWRAFTDRPVLWEAVSVNPGRVAEGHEVMLQSASIDPDQELEITIGEVPVPSYELLSGRLLFHVPAVRGLNAGDEALPLRIESAGFLLFETTLQYGTITEIRAIEPQRVRVGEQVAIIGDGLPTSVRGTRVRFGSHYGRVALASSGRVTATVPMVTREGNRNVEVAIETEGTEIVARERLEVMPRIVAPVSVAFSAAYVPGLDAWHIRSPLGSAFYLRVDGPPPPPDEPMTSAADWPDEVRASVEALDELFRLATDDSELRVEVQPFAERGVEGGWEVRAVGPSYEEGRLLARLDEADFEATFLAGGTRLPADLFVFWQSTVWNRFLDTFARARPPELSADAPRYHQVLHRLIEINRENGGYGRPEPADLERLDADDLAILRGVLMSPPSDFGDLSGAWDISLANVFYPSDDIQVRLRLDLEHRGGAVLGRASISFEDDILFLRDYQTKVSGRYTAGSPPRVSLVMDFGEPVGQLVLEGVAERSLMSGRFQSADRRPGEWSGRPIGD